MAAKERAGCSLNFLLTLEPHLFLSGGSACALITIAVGDLAILRLCSSGKQSSSPS
jgi:hypothetical protein